MHADSIYVCMCAKALNFIAFRNMFRSMKKYKSDTIIHFIPFKKMHPAQNRATPL